MAFGGNFYASSGETVSLGLAYTGEPASGTVLDGFATSAGDLVRDGDGWRLAMPAADVAVSATFRAATGYETWAADNGVAGAWDSTDAGGVHNVFRYAFDIAEDSPTNPPLLAISFDANGRPVIETPPLNPDAVGFTISILATDTLDGDNPATYPIGPLGETVIPATDSHARFFRLKVEEK